MYNQWLIYILYTTSYHFTSPHIARWRQKALLWELLRSGTGLMSRINWESMVSQTKTIAIKHHQTPGRKTNASWVLIWKTVRQPFPMQMMEPEKKQANASVSANHARKRAYVSVMIAGTEYKHGRQREKPTRWVARIKLLWSQILCFWPTADFRAASCTYYGHTVLMYPYVTFIIHDMFLIGKKSHPSRSSDPRCGVSDASRGSTSSSIFANTFCLAKHTISIDFVHLQPFREQHFVRDFLLKYASWSRNFERKHASWWCGQDDEITKTKLSFQTSF